MRYYLNSKFYYSNPNIQVDDEIVNKSYTCITKMYNEWLIERMNDEHGLYNKSSIWSKYFKNYWSKRTTTTIEPIPPISQELIKTNASCSSLSFMQPPSQTTSTQANFNDSKTNEEDLDVYKLNDGENKNENLFSEDEFDLQDFIIVFVIAFMLFT